MPFEKVNIKERIEELRSTDPVFKKTWDDSRMEYRLLGEIIKLRKKKGLSQKELAEKIGSMQQVISRIEKHEQSPTLKTLCNMANALDMEIMFVPRSKRN
jgi:ribosome-binding protein aMBF1 (putative translation factor)